MAQIYGLFSARNGIVRYVGQTTGACSDRFRQHRRAAERWPTIRLYKWFHSEWIHGYPIRCVLLQSCDAAARHEIETEWIKKFPKLLNKRKISWARLIAPIRKPPEVPEISAYVRSHIFNVDGFRGVHYLREHDRYFVLFYTGYRAEWLLGDEIPGWGEASGNIWFSDLAAAVNARDKRRQSSNMNWLPDRES